MKSSVLSKDLCAQFAIIWKKSWDYVRVLTALRAKL